MNVRPMNDWVLVNMDPIETKIGSIFIPEGVDHRKATVSRVGPEAEKYGLMTGQRVVFNRAHGEHLQGKRIRLELGGDQLLIRALDILFIMDEEVDVS